MSDLRLSSPAVREPYLANYVESMTIFVSVPLLVSLSFDEQAVDVYEVPFFLRSCVCGVACDADSRLTLSNVV